MKQFLVCWDETGYRGVWVFNGSKWRFRKKYGWVDSKVQDWKVEEFEHSLKVNNFKEK